MKTLLLLALIASTLAQLSINIDCTNGGRSGNRLTGCTGTYQAQLNFTTAAFALQDWVNFCLSDVLGGGNGGANGVSVGGGDTITISGDCQINNQLLGSIFDFPADFPGSDPTGNFTIQGPASITIVNGGGGGGGNARSLVHLDSANNVAAHTGGVLIKDLTITGRQGQNDQFRLVQAERGNVFVENVVLVDVVGGIGSGFIEHTGNTVNTQFGTIPQYTVGIDGLDFSQTNNDDNHRAIVVVQSGVDIVANNIKVHDALTGPVIFLQNGNGDGETTINANDITIDNVQYDLPCGVIFCGSNSLQNVAAGQNQLGRQNFAIAFDTVAVTDSRFSVGGYPLLYLNPDYTFVDGTFSLANPTFTGNVFNSLINAIRVYGRGATDFTGGTVSDNTITFPQATNAFYKVDNTDGATITTSTFQDNTEFAFGMIHTGSFSANTAINSCNFIGNNATFRRQWTSAGGALHLEGSSFLDSCNFTQNRAENGGAAFITDNTDAFFTNSVFLANDASAQTRRVYAVGHGGAVLKNLDGTTTFTGCTFDGNNANHAGGAIAALVDERLDGAGAYYGDGGDVQITDSSFDNNVAAEVAGAILFNARNLIVTSTNLTSNTAQTGGAVSSTDVNPFVSSPLLFRDCQFRLNIALGGAVQSTTLRDGGAVSTFRASTFNKVLFEQNEAQNGNGGAIVCYKGLDAQYSNFKSNTASGLGGAIWSNPVQPEKLRLFRSDFVQNSGSDGGAIWSNNPLTMFDGATFSENTASGNGGAVFLNTEATIRGTGFSQNIAQGDGGAIYSVGDADVDSSRFDTNSASNGGAIFCMSDPLGTVDFTLMTSRSIFNNNNVSGNGGAIETSCTMTDVGSTFTESTQSADSYGVECLGDNRILRGCELSFTNSRFEKDSLGVIAAATPVGSLSTGLVIVGSHFNEFTGEFEAETTSIATSEFSAHTVNVQSPTTIADSSFTGGSENYLSGSLDASGSDWHDGTVNVSSTDAASFEQSSFEAMTVDVYNGGATLVDVKATKNTNITFHGPADLTRVNGDGSSSITTTQGTTIADSSVGTFSGTTGTINLVGTLTIGGEGLTSTLSVPLSGNGDLIVTGGIFNWVDGDITGSGDFIIQSGEAHLESGAALDRTTTAEEDAIVYIDGNPAFTLSANFDAKGGAVFGPGVVKIEDSGSGAAFNTWMDTYFGDDSTVGPAYHNYGNLHFDILDRNTYDKVTFETSFETENTSFVFALDNRVRFEYEDLHYDNNDTTYLRDIGNRFQIITLPNVFDIDACECVSPFAGAVYTYNVSVRFPDRDHEGERGARISTRNESSDDATNFLYLYSDASSFRPFGLFFLVILALLF